MSSGHRKNLLNGGFREIGIAQEEGVFTYDGRNWNTSMLTEKFAKSGSDIFVTGVVYDDLDENDYFSIGEGRSGALFSVGNVNDVSADTGGYAIAVSPQASLTVSISYNELQGSLSVELAGKNVKVDLVDGNRVMLSKSATLLTGITDATLLGVSDLNLEGSADADNLTGNRGNNSLAGNDGNDAISGGQGADMIAGERGNDTLLGGADNDTIEGGNSSDVFLVDGLDVVTDTGPSGYDKAQILSQLGELIDMTAWQGVERINGNIGNDTIDASAQTIALTLSGGDGADSLIGGSGVDILIGGQGDDTLVGGVGNNLFVGGTGNDEMTGGSGDEIFFIGENGDVITDAGEGFDRAVLNGMDLSITVGDWAGVERIVGFEGDDSIDASGGAQSITLTGGAGADNLSGTDFADVFLGGVGADVIVGGEGNDTIDGGGDADQMSGGGGNDLFFVGETSDVVTDGGEGNDVVAISNSSGLSINVGSWNSVERIVGQNGADNVDATGMLTAVTILGGDGNDTLTGGSGNDTLIGGADGDQLNGGVGDDLLIGSSGADSFVFEIGFGQDMVADYTDGVDRLDFSQHAGVNDIDDLQIDQEGNNTVITLTAGGSDNVMLAGVSAGLLDASDFDFV